MAEQPRTGRSGESGRPPRPHRVTSDMGDTATLATYRLLLSKGFTSDAAANLTAYLCGIQVGDVHWQLIEVNRLLFLRRLARTGSWGAFDGAPQQTH
jgi:hypothetical protein